MIVIRSSSGRQYFAGAVADIIPSKKVEAMVDDNYSEM